MVFFMGAPPISTLRGRCGQRQTRTCRGRSREALRLPQDRMWLKSGALPALPGPRVVTTLLAMRARGLVGAVEPLELATAVGVLIELVVMPTRRDLLVSLHARLRIGAATSRGSTEPEGAPGGAVGRPGRAREGRCRAPCHERRGGRQNDQPIRAHVFILPLHFVVSDSEQHPTLPGAARGMPAIAIFQWRRALPVADGSRLPPRGQETSKRYTTAR